MKKDLKNLTQMTPMKFVIGIFVVISFGIIYLAVSLSSDPHILQRGKMTTDATGTVTEVIRDHESHKSGESAIEVTVYRYRVSYDDRDGGHHTVLSVDTTRDRRYEQNTPVNVRYDPKDPDGGCVIKGKAASTTTTPVKPQNEGGSTTPQT